MSQIFFTADTHFGHENIIKFCKRPFKSVKNMDNQILCNINNIVKKEDTLIHLGYFGFQNRNNLKSIKGQIIGKFILIAGNHDNNNLRNECEIQNIIMKLGKYNCYLIHDPNKINLTLLKIKKIDFVICGHVHEKWKHKWLKGNIPMINVGTDVWNFKPVSKSTILNYYNNLMKEKNKSIFILFLQKFRRKNEFTSKG